MSNTKIKFVLVTTDQDLRDADVRNVSISILMYFVLKLPFFLLCYVGIRLVEDGLTQSEG